MFCVASVGCRLAPSLGVLVVARGVQGVGAALVNVASLALVGAAFPDPRAKARAIGIWTGIATIGLAIGPTVGGVLTEEVGWRSVFVFNPIIGAVAIVLTYRYVVESQGSRSRGLRRPRPAAVHRRHRHADVRADPGAPERLVVGADPRSRSRSPS